MQKGLRRQNTFLEEEWVNKQRKGLGKTKQKIRHPCLHKLLIQGEIVPL